MEMSRVAGRRDMRPAPWFPRQGKSRQDGPARAGRPGSDQPRLRTVCRPAAVSNKEPARLAPA